MNIEKHIQKLLLDNASVEVPHLGIFKKTFRSSYIDKEDQIHPPSSKAEFEIQMDLKGIGLIESVANEAGVSSLVAKQMLADYVDEIKESLEQKNEYTFEGLGTLLKFSSGKTDFAPSKNSNFYLDTLGLTAIKVPQKGPELNDRIQTDNKPDLNSTLAQKNEPKSINEMVSGDLKNERKLKESQTDQPLESTPKSTKAGEVVKEDLKANTAPVEKKMPAKDPLPETKKVEPVQSKPPVEEPKPLNKVDEKEIPKKEPVAAKPVEKEEPKKAVAEKPARPERISKPYVEPKRPALMKILLPLLLFLGGAYGIYHLLSGDETNEVSKATSEVIAPAKTEPVEGVETTDESLAEEKMAAAETTVDETKTPADESVATPPKKEVVKKEEPKRSRSAASGGGSKGYYIVTGAFREAANADKAVQKLSNQGYDARVIETRGLHQVAVYGTQQKQEAQRLQTRLIAEGNRGAWILKK